MTTLPESFVLHVESKPDDWWKITAPAVHAGLFICHQDLGVALADVPAALGALLEMDSAAPVMQKPIAAADRLHDAIRAFLRSLATGPLGAQPTIALRDLLASPEVQELSDAADALERDDGRL